MMGILDAEIKVNCSKCKRIHIIKLKKVTEKYSFTCTCGQKISLVDKDDGVKKADKMIKDIFKNFK